FRVRKAIVNVTKMRKQLPQVQLQTARMDIFKHVSLPSRRLIQEQTGKEGDYRSGFPIHNGFSGVLRWFEANRSLVSNRTGPKCIRC
ncbi:hypothetical protein AAVH_37815, partial [Aphelenchoides avenae]